jgi:VanZ family protein
MFLRSNLPGIAWALLILVVCGMPGDEVPESPYLDFPYLDKLVHGILFLVLALLLSAGFKRQFSLPLLRDRSKTAGFIAAVIYGGLIEGMQYFFLPERSLEAGDLLGNTVGAGLGVVSFRALYGKGSG